MIMRVPESPCSRRRHRRWFGDVECHRNCRSEVKGVRASAFVACCVGGAASAIIPEEEEGTLHLKTALFGDGLTCQSAQSDTTDSRRTLRLSLRTGGGPRLQWWTPSSSSHCSMSSWPPPPMDSSLREARRGSCGRMILTAAKESTKVHVYPKFLF